MELSSDTKTKIDAVAARYPSRQAACLPALHLAQAAHGALDDEVLAAVALHLGLSPAFVHGVASFYTMFRRAPSGPAVLRVCTSVSCFLRGAPEVLAALARELGVEPGQTKDGVTLVEEECLAACASAPAAVCGQTYFLDLKPADAARVLAEARGKTERID